MNLNMSPIIITENKLQGKKYKKLNSDKIQILQSYYDKVVFLLLKLKNFIRINIHQKKFLKNLKF